jgi:hypothetical protein
MSRLAPNPKIPLDLKLVHEVVRHARTDHRQTQEPAIEPEITPEI